MFDIGALDGTNQIEIFRFKLLISITNVIIVHSTITDLGFPWGRALVRSYIT